MQNTSEMDNAYKINELFKYRSNEGEHSLDILSNNRFYFSTPNQFNDPFDASIPFDYSLVSKKYLMDMAKRNTTGHDRKSRRLNQKKLYRKVSAQRGNFGSVTYQSQIEYVNETIGIFCLSQEPDNLLLWSYYANSHKGFCIGFDYEKLKRSINHTNPRLVKEGKGFLQIEQVIYSQSYPRINPETFDTVQKFILPLKTKSHHWSHEKEYRIIFTHGPNHRLNFNDNIYSRIILGANSDSKLKNSIIEILKRMKTKIPLFKAELSKMKYEIQLLKVDY